MLVGKTQFIVAANLEIIACRTEVIELRLTDSR